MDTSLRELIPEADLPRLMQSYTRQRRKRELKKMIRQLPGDMLSLQRIIDYPREFFETAIYKGAVVRRLAQVFEGTATRVSRLAAMVLEIGSAFFFFFTLAFAAVSLDQHTTFMDFPIGHPVKDVFSIFPGLDPQVWLLLILLMLNASLSLARLARRFRKQD